MAGVNTFQETTVYQQCPLQYQGCLAETGQLQSTTNREPPCLVGLTESFKEKGTKTTVRTTN